MKRDFNEIKTYVTNTIATTLAEKNCILYDIIYIYEFDQDVIQIMMENLDGSDMDFDKLTDLSNEINQLLDKDSTILGDYAIEVTTPGLERPIRSWPDFIQALHRYVHCEFKIDVNGSRELDGEIIALDEANCTFTLRYFIKGVKKENVFSYSNVSKARWAVKF